MLSIESQRVGGGSDGDDDFLFIYLFIIFCIFGEFSPSKTNDDHCSPYLTHPFTSTIMEKYEKLQILVVI